ncbi:MULTISPECIES: efflux RND transporter periplasmic adaptor subunit [Clostridium]|nr:MULTISPECIES: efflux RND transporter periplasmic adaptor subunit [Clostridium]POO85406.1 hydrogenase expression protein HypA [Clostridium sp. 3-3]AXB84913.1 HlyD family efflux transporter periplasmic adaptor subunit [Clostridium butyricum]KIU07939.1 HylD family protein [Clostridium butyricum]MBA8967780.1 multidrug resistance efflux pump [Clostridium butyricum]MBA8971166.1 multidrug resistance efflux pump [Clostridium butyricum]
MKTIELIKLKPKNISFKKIKHKKTIIFMVIILIIFSAIGVIMLKPKDTIVKDYTKLEKSDIIKNVNTLGTIESNDKINVYSTLNNVIKEVKVQAGDKVNEGDVLCVLDSSVLEKEIAEATSTLEHDKEKAKIELEGKKQAYDNASYIYENNIDSSITDSKEALNTAQIKLNDAQRDYDQKKTLYDNGAVSQSDLDNAKSTLDQAKSDYDKSSASLENAKVKAKEAVNNAKNEYDSALIEYNNNKDEISLKGKKDDLDKCVIKAPASGTITTVNASVGNTSQGVLFTIENLDDPIIMVNVKEIDVNKINPGQEVEVTTDAAPDDKYAKGKVLSISDTIKTSEGTFNTNSNSDNKSGTNSTSSQGFQAKIKLDNPKENDFIKVGMNAKANIILDKSMNVFSVPFSSILEEESGKYIKIAKDNNDNTYTVCKLPVTTGLETDVSVEIENSDLTEGDNLLLDPSLYEEGQIIKLVPADGGQAYE